MLTSSLMLIIFLVAFHGVREPRRQSKQDLRRAKLMLMPPGAYLTKSILPLGA